MDRLIKDDRPRVEGREIRISSGYIKPIETEWGRRDPPLLFDSEHDAELDRLETPQHRNRRRKRTRYVPVQHLPPTRKTLQPIDEIE